MRRIRIGLFVALLPPAALVLAGCGGGGGDPIASIPPEDFSGTWFQTTVINTDNCGTGLVGTTVEGIGVVQQTGSDVIGESFDVCGTFLGGFVATVNGSVITTSQEFTAFVDPTCSLQISEVVTGTLSGTTVSGTDVLTVSAIGDCGAGLPCEISGAFIAEMCPPADCSFLACLSQPLSAKDAIMKKAKEKGFQK